MIRRLRPLVALLALLALSAFVVESAWALVCTPAMAACEAGMETCSPASASNADAGEHAPEAPHAGSSSDGSQHAPAPAPACPMAMAAGCVVAAVPAVAAVTQPEIVQQDLVLPSFDRTPDLLVIAGPFRPPRA